MKKKIARMNTTALTPARRIAASSSCSPSSDRTDRRGRATDPLRGTGPAATAPGGPGGAPGPGAAAGVVRTSLDMRRGHRNVAVLLDQALAGRGLDPVHVALHLTLGLPERVEEERAGQRIGAVERVLDRGRDGRLALLVREPQHLHARRRVAHAAVADRGLRAPDQLHHLLGTVHVARSQLEV